MSACVLGVSALLPPQAVASSCSPDALGTARVLTLPAAYGPVGRVNYPQSLPLERGEVVLTFDDGPLPRRTEAVLEALRRECVKATFFVVGTMVSEFPNLLRRTAADGHTIATHTWSHRYLNRVRDTGGQRDQINAGLLAARAALGDAHPSLSPFFRFPGLGSTPALNQYVIDQRLVPFSIDVDGDDWKRITPSQVMERVLARLEARGKGIILLHDIQERTVAILPELLRELKARGYRVVHVVPDTGDTQLALAAAELPGDRRMRVALGRLDRSRDAIAVATAGSPPPAVDSRPTPVVQVARADEPSSWTLRMLPGTDELKLDGAGQAQRTLKDYRATLTSPDAARTASPTPGSALISPSTVTWVDPPRPQPANTAPVGSSRPDTRIAASVGPLTPPVLASQAPRQQATPAVPATAPADGLGRAALSEPTTSGSDSGPTTAPIKAEAATRRAPELSTASTRAAGTHDAATVVASAVSVAITERGSDAAGARSSVAAARTIRMAARPEAGMSTNVAAAMPTGLMPRSADPMSEPSSAASMPSNTVSRRPDIVATASLHALPQAPTKASTSDGQPSVRPGQPRAQPSASEREQVRAPLGPSHALTDSRAALTSATSAPAAKEPAPRGFTVLTVAQGAAGGFTEVALAR